MPEFNGTMMQYFHWYNPNDGSLWSKVESNAAELAATGFTGIWLPPAYKGMNGVNDVGYGVYDMYDLGEFNQRGKIPTKYGTRDQYIAAVKALQRSGIQVYADAVLNHRMGGDSTETPKATFFSQDNRLQAKSGLQEIQSWTHFHFPGRGGKHSRFEWHWWHFDAVDYDHRNPKEKNTVYLLEGKRFDDYVSLDRGNFSYLMGCDLDCQHPEVQKELIDWGKWYLDTVNPDGFRLDAIKHISAWFFPLWLDALEQYAGKDLFVVGEYWQNHLDVLLWYIDKVGGRMSVFDVPLHYNFHIASRSSGHYDMRRILDGTVMKHRPTHAVTFVENHDSQPLQALESVVEPWFKPLAYALILLRQEGYPCVFYADYYGADYTDHNIPIHLPSHRWLIDRFLQARTTCAFGPQYDYFDHPDVIGWTRLGSKEHPHALAVIMSDGPGGSKWMEVGKPNTTFVDLTDHVKQPVHTNHHGWGEFRCNGGSVSVWVEQSLQPKLLAGLRRS